MTTIAIIGGGPAGYVAAITAAQQGKDVILIEKGNLGGTCLNEGCMPTKSLLESAEHYQTVKNAAAFGINLPTEQVSIDWQVVQLRKNEIIQTLVGGIQYLMKRNKIKVIKGEASFLTSNRLSVLTAGGVQVVEADRIIVASGSEPVQLPFALFDGEWVIHSGQAMELQEVPASMVVIGGGVIGCEFASIYSRLGTKVTIVEMADQLLPGEDRDIASVLHGQLEGDGVTIHTSTSLKGTDPEKKTVTLETNGSSFEAAGDYVLISIGRKPRIAELGLEKIGIDFTGRGIAVNEHMQTNIPSIYACGDAIGGIQLAHTAFHEGKIAALHACGEEAAVNYRAVPRCIYTSPEIAGVGLTEKQAREEYGDIRVGEIPFAANGKALIANRTSGKVKVIIEQQFNELLGISIVGHHATELIGQGTVMLHAELTSDLMEHFIAAHPTLSEAVNEAILSAVGHAVHA